MSSSSVAVREEPHADSRPLGRARRPVRGCKVCTHLERTKIELDLANGMQQKAVADRYSVSHDSVGRHWARHVDDERKARLRLGPVPRMALQARVCEENSNVLDNLKVVRAGLYQSLDLALQVNDGRLVASLSGRLHENLGLLAKITGELAQSPLVQTNVQLNLTMQPEFARFQADLVRALAPFPAAYKAVIAEFERLEAEATPLPTLEHDHGATAE